MKIKLIIGFLISSLATTTFASQTFIGTPPAGYPSRPPVYDNNNNPHVRNNNQFYVSVNTPNFNASYYDGRPYRHQHSGAGPEWINMQRGFDLPYESVIGGGENGYPLYVCRANYYGGQHPGKLLPDGGCHFSYGGNEIISNNYQVLISHNALQWIASSYGYIPGRAIVGGFENGHPLYICQANYAGGEHPGKVVGANCDIGYGGREIAVPYYNVLTM